MRATRLSELDVDLDSISTNFSHLDHMYSGRLSEYYYARFDQALSEAEISPDDRVLEVGGGTGVLLLSLVELADEVHFSDISREDPYFRTSTKLLEAAGLDSNEVRYAVADATRLPYADDSFDKIFVLDVLEHLLDEPSAVEELGRVTAPGGRTIVSGPIEVGPPVVVREVYRMLDGKRHYSESIQELSRSALGNPVTNTDSGHRGYDYRETINRIKTEFSEVSVSYCPFPRLKWLNPTAIITATAGN